MSEVPEHEHDDRPDSKHVSRRVVVAVLLFQAFLLVMLGGAFLRAESQNKEQQEEIQQSLDTGRGIIACTVQWADDMTTALEDRDAINSTARTAAIDWLGAILKQAEVPQNQQDPQTILNLIAQYRDALKALNTPEDEGGFPTAKYPDIRDCLEKNGLPLPEELAERANESSIGPFRLVANEFPAPLPAAGNGHPGKWDNKCLHRKVTIRGTDGNDNISGTRGRDVIFAYSGDDLVAAGNGRDRICGRFGGDVLNGENGFDRINGGNGGGLDLCFGERTKKCP